MKSSAVIIVLLLTLFFAACSRSSHHGQPSLEEAGAYLYALQQLSDMEQNAVSAYKAVSGPNFIDDKTLYTALDKETLPVYRDFANRLMQIEPQNMILSNYHVMYMEAVRKQLRGFQLTYEYLLYEDTQLKQEAFDEMQEAQQLMNIWQVQLNNLTEALLQEEDAN